MKRAFVLAAAAAGSLLGFAPGAHADLRAGDNFRLSSDSTPTRGKDQLGLAVNPNNPQHIVAVMENYLTEECEGTRSLDGGATWSAADPFANPAPAPGTQPFASTCRIGNHLADQMFQTVVFGTGQNVYATYGSPRTTLAGGEEGANVFVIKSTDGGQTWGTGVIALPGGNTPSPTNPGPYYELPTVAVDPGQGVGGADRIVAAGHEVTSAIEAGGPPPVVNGDAMVSVSNDGGATFTAPVRAEPAGEDVGGPDSTSEPVIFPDHSIGLSWRTAGATAAVRFAQSSGPAGAGNNNPAATWEPAVNVTGVTAGGNTSNTNPPVPQQSTGSTFPRMAVDRSGGANNGRLYIVYNQGTPPGPGPGPYLGQDHFIHHDTDVYFQRSLDSGATWSTPKLLNDATPYPGTESPGFGPVTQTRHPNVTVAPNGRVDIAWEDRHHWYRGCIHTHVICDEARLGDTYYSFSTNGGTSFSKDRRISDRSHNNDVGYDYRFGVGWAYGPRVVPVGNDQLLIGWMDSRNGNPDNDNLDITLSRVNHNAPATVPQQNVSEASPTALSVRLSQHTYPGGGESLLASTFATRPATKVVIVNQNDFPAILAAGVLARANLSQVLLSPPGGLPAAVKAEVDRLNPVGAYVIGDTTSLSAQVVQDLVDAGVPNGSGEIERLGTANDAETAKAISEELDRRFPAQKTANSPAFNAAVVVNPASPDAAAVAGLAGAKRLPVLFTGVNSVPQATLDALAAQDIDKTLVIGNATWVGNGVLGQFPGAERIGGADQYATSRDLVNESLERGLPDNIVYVTDGTRPVDGALVGSAAGRTNGLHLLAPAALSSNAPTIVGQLTPGLRLDRMLLVNGAQAGTPIQYPGPPGPPIGGTPAFVGCPSSTANVINGTAGPNTINGTAAGDRIFALGGDDRVNALAGRDCVDLGTGDDNGSGGSGGDRIVGRSGNDRIGGGSSGDRLSGNSGSDRISGNSGNDGITGSTGRDRIAGGSGRDRISGNSGRDSINGNSGRDRVSGNSGSDRLVGGSGRDRISGGSGRDRINARDGAVDRVNCGSGRDSVRVDSSDIIASNCEAVSLVGASSAAAAGASLGGVAGLVGGAYVALLGWRRRRDAGMER